jgi:hypothetical protein
MSPHRVATALVLLASISLTGCVRRDGRNSDCQWREEPDAKALAPNQRGYASHLRKDVEFAEELAVEYMDAHHRPRSGKFKSQQAASQALNTCFALWFFGTMLVGKLRRRYPPEDGWTVALIMIILSSLALGIGGMMLGEQASTLVENIRAGTGHLSYRVDVYRGCGTKSVSLFCTSFCSGALPSFGFARDSSALIVASSVIVD